MKVGDTVRASFTVRVEMDAVIVAEQDGSLVMRLNPEFSGPPQPMPMAIKTVQHYLRDPSKLDEASVSRNDEWLLWLGAAHVPAFQAEVEQIAGRGD